MRVLKPCKLKSISLSFRGIQKTDWPEGIPPKRNVYAEVNDLVNHSWPFYNAENPVPNHGADMYVPSGKGRPEDAVALELQLSPIATVKAENGASPLFMSSLVRKAASSLTVPSPTVGLTPVSSFQDLTAVLSGLSQADLSKIASAMPGDYVYNFEHPIPALSPETTLVNFGVVHYYLEASISRLTTFKSNLSGRLPIKVVRIPCDNSVEENEPIVIERDWEDQLRYEIVIASKSVVLDTFLPISLKFIPLYGKVALHRIRIFITQDCNYYCHGKSVHRTEPSRKYLLLEHKANKNMSLLSKNGGQGDPVPDDEVLPRELEFQMYVPSLVNKKHTYTIHPDTAVENIQCTHWIKISLRISRQDLDNPDKRKHFEILIDSPIHLYSPLAAHNLTLLPRYNPELEFLPQYTQSPIDSPDVTAIDASRDGSGILSVLETANHSDISRAATPIEFRHINSLSNNDDPIERDNSIHLESNLYQPDNADVLDAIGSPQARAYTPAVSPVASPLLKAPQPSRDPPAFDALGLQGTLDTLPPAYDRNHSSLSLSPLRLDRSPVRSGAEPIGIKNKLFKQLDNFELNSSDARSTKSSGSKSSNHSRSSKGSKVSDMLMSEPSEGSELEISRPSQSEDFQETMKERDTGKGSDRGALKNDEHTETQSTKPVERGSQSVDGINSSVPEHSKAASHLEPTDLLLNPEASLQHSSSLGEHARSRSPSVSSSRLSASHRSLVDKYATDLADFGGLNGNPNYSRNSSVALSIFQTNLDENLPMEQTIPLLTFSSTSINEDGLSFGRSAVTDSMTDLAPTALGGFSICDSLGKLDNPRLTKHYQDSRHENEVNFMANKTRQKSFGVVPDIPLEPVLGPDSDDSGSTIDEYSQDIGFVPNPAGSLEITGA